MITFFFRRPNKSIFYSKKDPATGPLQIGDVVSYKCWGWTSKKGIPRERLIYRLRSDLTWDDVILSETDDKMRVKQFEGKN